MAYIRRRRYAMKPRRNRRLSKKRRTMAILKKDIRKCNFPNKVKFLGMTERKTMFLYKEEILNTQNWSYYLEPVNTSNVGTLRSWSNVGAEGHQSLAMLTNWDKFCVLGIYVRFQPVANVYDGTVDAQSISQIKCTYTMNNVDTVTWLDDKNNVHDGFNPNYYDTANINNKQVFTFNSNESFTLYIPAPTTMCFNSPVVQKSKTWWSLSEIKPIDYSAIRRADGFSEDSDEDDYDREGVLADNQFSMHCGRIHLESNQAIRYNVTINYKVALKG